MELVYYPDPRLTQRASDISEVDDDIRARAERMIEIMHEKRGIGLAANQVGWLERLIVINPTGERGAETVLVNPVIEEHAGAMTGEEGCLSVPGVYADIDRAETVTVRALDLEGNEFRLEGDGILAVVLQHEIDHLDGVLFLTKMTAVDRMRHRKRLKELDRRYRERADS